MNNVGAPTFAIDKYSYGLIGRYTTDSRKAAELRRVAFPQNTWDGIQENLSTQRAAKATTASRLGLDVDNWHKAHMKCRHQSARDVNGELQDCGPIGAFYEYATHWWSKGLHKWWYNDPAAVMEEMQPEQLMAGLGMEFGDGTTEPHPGHVLNDYVRDSVHDIRASDSIIEALRNLVDVDTWLNQILRPACLASLHAPAGIDPAQAAACTIFIDLAYREVWETSSPSRG
jgi:hypothetical protein